jgi:hypothetical protein
MNLKSLNREKFKKTGFKQCFMNKSIAFIILIFCFCLQNKFALGQNTWDKVDSLIINGKLNPKVQKYYSTIYKAEDAIVKEKFAKAAKIYEKAFSGSVIPFRYDLKNAIQCELKSSPNKQNMFRYVNLLIRKGDKKEKFYNDSSLLALDFWQELKNVIDTSVCLIDSSTIKFMSFLIENDQDYRRQCNEKYDGNTYNEFTIDSINIIDSLNYERILNFIKNNDIISEEVFGNFQAISLIITHNRHRPQAYELLYNDVINGNLDTRAYYDELQLTGYRFNGVYTLGKDSHGWILGTQGTQVYFYHTESTPEKFNIKKIDKYRKKLYCDKVVSFHKKKAWGFSHGFEFFRCWLTEQIMTESQLAKIIKSDENRKNRNIIFNDESVREYYYNLLEEQE